MASYETRPKKMKVSHNWGIGDVNLHEEVVQSANIENCTFALQTQYGIVYAVGQLQGEVNSTPVVVGQLIEPKEEVMDSTETNTCADATGVAFVQNDLNPFPNLLAHVQDDLTQELSLPTIVLSDQMQINPQPVPDVKETKKRKSRNHEMQCHLCNAVFNGRSELLKHQKTIHPNMNSGTVKCKEDDCNFACFRVNQLVEHLTSAHQFEIFEEELEFSDETEFLSWKEDYEIQANCQYRLTSSKAGGKCRYFNCSRSGYYVRKQEKDLTRRSKLKGTSKLNGHCVAGIIVKSLDDGKRHVMHTKTHYGHDLETNHLRISPSQRSYIRVLVESGLPVDDIVQKVNTMKSAGVSIRVTRKDVVNVVSSFQSKKLSTDFNFSSPYSAWNVSNVALQLKGNIIFHKASGEYNRDAPNLNLSDFMLCIMSPNQIERLSRHRFSGLGVHLVIDPISKDGLVIICVYACVPYVGKKTVDLPFAWCVSNANHDEILRVFFSSIRQKCGDLNPKYLVSENGFNIYGPWCETFPSAPLNVTAPWSVQESITSGLQKYVKSAFHRENLLNSIKSVFSDKLADFTSRMGTLMEGMSCPEYLRFAKEYFIPNFIEGTIPNFAAVHYAEHASEIMVFEEVTSTLRQKMLQACYKAVSRAVSDVLRYNETKERNHAKVQCYSPGAVTSQVKESMPTNSADQSKVGHLSCMVTNVMGMLDDGYFPADFDKAVRLLEDCEKLIAESCTPPKEASPEEKQDESTREIPESKKRNPTSVPSNYLRVKNRGLSGRLKLQSTMRASNNSASNMGVRVKPGSESIIDPARETWEQEIIPEEYILLEEVVDSE